MVFWDSIKFRVEAFKKDLANPKSPIAAQEGFAFKKDLLQKDIWTFQITMDNTKIMDRKHTRFTRKLKIINYQTHQVHKKTKFVHKMRWFLPKNHQYCNYASASHHILVHRPLILFLFVCMFVCLLFIELADRINHASTQVAFNSVSLGHIIWMQGSIVSPQVASASQSIMGIPIEYPGLQVELAQ